MRRAAINSESTRHRKPTHRRRTWQLERLEPRWVLAAAPVIGELLADNDSILFDEDGGSDGQISSSREAEGIMRGQFNVSSYNIRVDVSGEVSVIDFAGGGGTSPIDNPYIDGSSAGLDDFAVLATAMVTIPEGDWTVGFGSDDDGFARLAGVRFSRVSNGNGDTGGDDEIRYDRPRAHGWTTGQISTPTGGMTTDLTALMYERGGEDSFEIAIRRGHDSGNVSSAT